MKRFKAVAGIVAIFALGLATGVLGTGLVVKHRIEYFREKGPPQVKHMFMDRIAHRLELTPDQQVKVDIILDDLQKELKAIRQDSQPRIRTAFDHSLDRIREILSAPQKEELEKIMEKTPFPPGRKFRHLHHPPGENLKDKTGGSR